MADEPTTLSERLKFARARAGYENATDAAARFGFPVIGYRSHENGNRGFKASVAKRYAKAYGVSAGWLITGEGPMVAQSIDNEISELPPDIQAETMKDIRTILAAAKIKGRIPRSK